MILLDGATGTELARRGIDTRTNLFSAAALLDERGQATLREVHRDYVKTGAQVVTANTFRTNPRKAGPRWRELTETAVRLARESGAPNVAGSIAPVEDCYLPELRPPPDVALKEHRRLAQALRGCDLLLVETVVAADEGLAAVQAAIETGLPVWVSAMVMPDGRMRSGDDLKAFFARARELGARATLVNCVPCSGVDLAIHLVDGAYAHMGDVDPNSGWPVTSTLSPEEYAARASKWLAKGATILGGCCGTTPAHIAALAKISPAREDPGQLIVPRT
ncbi:MAG: homocysteine S-methyltransferase family protein [Myxococcales bacterium]|nr:homocysteine S-methyltransferase family protein [Myxococcales bacterium]